MRQPGFYWVKRKGEWEVAGYYIVGNVGGWELTGEANILITDTDFEEIDERRIERSDKDVIDSVKDIFNVIKSAYPNEDPPKYITDNPYLCKSDES